MITEITTGVSSTSTIGRVVAKPGQSIYDICLDTYGSLDFLYKLLTDNNIVGINYQSIVGLTFTFDTTKITNSSLFQRNKNDRIFYATLYSPPAGIDVDDIELRENITNELREDGTLELRE